VRFKTLKDAEAAGIPPRIDGAKVTLDAANALGDIVAKVREANRKRDVEEIFDIAIGAFRKSHEIVGGEWRPVAYVRLGANGDGPLLRNKFATGAGRRRALARETAVVAGDVAHEAEGSEAAEAMTESCLDYLYPLVNCREVMRDDMVILEAILRVAVAMDKPSSERAAQLLRVVQEEINA
jgi:hypothetical protein